MDELTALVGSGDLKRYRGRWVAVVNQRVVADGESASEAEANMAAAVPGFGGPTDPLIFRVVPHHPLAVFLRTGQ